jgi:cytochrome P450 / NADPH-cytochrome P450 reductase
MMFDVDRILMPIFGPSAVRGMWDDMKDIASQLLHKWERYARFLLYNILPMTGDITSFGPRFDIEPADDFSRFTFDTIALCAMSYR